MQKEKVTYPTYLLNLVTSDLTELINKEVRSSFPYLHLIKKMAIVAYMVHTNVGASGTLANKINGDIALRWFFNNVMARERDKRYYTRRVATKIITTERVGFPRFEMSVFCYLTTHLNSAGSEYGLKTVKINILHMLSDAIQCVCAIMGGMEPFAGRVTQLQLLDGKIRRWHQYWYSFKNFEE